MPTWRLLALITLPLMLSGCLAAVVGGGAAATSSVNDQRSVGTQIDDVTLTTKIDARLIAERDMPSRWVSVQVIDGKATLTGHLPTKRHIQRAIYITENIRGVRGVHSELMVGKPALGSIMSDSWITAQIKSKLWNDEQVSGFSIKVETVEGKVYLQGYVNTFIQRQRTKDLVHKVKGVTAIIDLMQVAKN
ncbi:osmotically-inducible protein Y precursor [Mariprofundus micogutta]|uniref:Osmotically-inducible protein Y n=2 Tax=Mariprofundus micogutta TaxID=1921010 RepID=A0A1L8CR75_9PROT|nr:osmotically-inducible protein Y precursor [Mariprofundus micogutta]